MANKKSNSRINEMDAQKRASERADQRTKRWQRLAFLAISVIVLASMILTLFIHP